MLRTAQLAASAPLLARLSLRPLSRAQGTRMLCMFSQAAENKFSPKNRQDNPNKQYRHRGRTSFNEALTQLRAMSTYDGYGPDEYVSIINCIMDVLEETDKSNAEKVQPVFKELPQGLLESNFSKVAERIPTFELIKMFRIRKIAQKFRFSHFCGKRQLKKALQVLSYRSEQKELGVEELISVYEGSKANRLVQSSITSSLKRFMYSPSNTSDKFLGTDMLRIMLATVQFPEDTQPNEKALITNMVSAQFDRILTMPIEHIAEIASSIAQLRACYMLPGFATSPEIIGLCRHIYRHLEKMDPKGYVHLLKLKRLLPRSAYEELFDLAMESLIELVQSEAQLLKPLHAYQLLQECASSFGLTKDERFSVLARHLTKFCTGQCKDGNKEYLALLEDWLTILAGHPETFETDILDELVNVAESTSGLQIGLVEFLALHQKAVLPKAFKLDNFPVHMQLRLGLVFKHLFSPSVLDQVQFQNFNYILDSPFYSKDPERKKALNNLFSTLAVPKNQSSNHRGRISPVISEGVASTFLKFLKHAKTAEESKVAQDQLVKFAKNASREEITMLLNEFMNQGGFHPPQVEYIQKVVAANSEQTDWDQLTNILFYNDTFFRYLMDSKTLEDFISFIIATAGQSPQWNFLLRFGVLKKLENFTQPTQQQLDSTAELLHTVLVSQAKGLGTLSVDLLVKSAAYFKKVDRLTLPGVIGLLEAVSSSQQPKLAVLQEYLVMLLEGIKSPVVRAKSQKDPKQLVYLRSNKHQDPLDEEAAGSPPPVKVDLSRYYLVLKHLLASKQIKFEENQPLSKVIAPIYLPDLKTGIFIISVSETGLKEDNQEAKLVKKVTRQIFEKMVEGCQVVILYPTDFDPSNEGSGVESILEQVASSQES